MARGPTLTFFLIGIVVFVGVMLLIYEPNYGLYNNFLIDNNRTPDNTYTQAFVGNLSSTQGGINTLQTNYSDSSWHSVVQTTNGILSGVLSTLIIGFEAMRTLSQIPVFFTTLFNSMSGMLFIPTIISWIIVTVIVIYLASKFIQALRGTINEA